MLGKRALAWLIIEKIMEFSDTVSKKGDSPASVLTASPLGIVKQAPLSGTVQQKFHADVPVNHAAPDPRRGCLQHCYRLVCDIEKLPEQDYAYDEERSYLPSICVPPTDCSIPLGSEKLKQSHCGYGQQCCRIDKVISLSQYFFQPYRELPHNMFHVQDWSIIGQYQYDDREYVYKHYMT
ncbi:hypothetical protein J6590_077990 [Homalodisca vitripennis]|nr:hypothetical protein J6590_077990 [Homalodisca vitripennis]